MANVLKINIRNFNLQVSIKVNTSSTIVVKMELLHINITITNVHKNILFTHWKCLIKTVLMKTEYLKNTGVTLSQHEENLLYVMIFLAIFLFIKNIYL